MKYVVDSVHRDGSVELTEAWSKSKHMPYRTTCRPVNAASNWLGKTVELRLVEVEEDKPENVEDSA